MSLIKTSIKLSRIIRKKHVAAVMLAGIMIFPGCSKLSGEFGFRTFFDQAYKKVKGVPEFRSSERVQWVFVFKEVKDTHSIGIIVQKKEIVWADVVKETKVITPERKIIYGTIENYPEGEYKIIILEENKILGNQSFLVYQNDEDTE